MLCSLPVDGLKGRPLPANCLKELQIQSIETEEDLQSDYACPPQTVPKISRVRYTHTSM